MPNDTSPIILWDIDGTLLAAGNGGLDHYHSALRDVVAGAPAPEISTHGKTDWQVIRELLTAAELSLSHAEEFSDRLDQLSTTFLETERLQLLPAVVETLEHFAAQRVRNGLLTGNSELRSRHKLAGAGLDLSLIDWNNSFFGARATRRAEIAIAARKSHPDGRLLIIGDTPFDGHAADEAGIAFLAVCTGKYARGDFGEIATVATLDALDIAQIESALAGLA
jgi:phosphoglycolate phosphatase